MLKGLERNNSQNDLALMTTAYYNEREERRHWWRVAKQLEKGMQMRINTLLLDKGMAGYELPKFHGRAGEDPEVFLTDFQRWCETANYDPNAGHNMRMRIHGIFETCLLGDSKDWYETNVKGKNWELENISDNCGAHADLNALNGLSKNEIRAINANQFRGGALQIRNTAPADGNQPAIPLVPSHTVWHEDWLTSGGRPTDLAPNAPNANVGGNVIAPNIFIGQVIDYFRRAYPTVTAEKTQLVFTTLAQGSDPVGRFYANLKRMVKLAYPTLPALNQEAMVRQQFFQGLSPDNKLEVRRIGLEYPISVLLPKLEEIERQKAEMMLGKYNPESHPVISRSQSKANTKDNYSSNMGMSRDETESFVKSIIASSQSQPVSTQSTSQRREGQLLRPSQMEPGKIYRDPLLRLNDQEWLRIDDATDRLSALAGPSYLQTFMDTISKGGMSELSINKAIAKGIEAGVNAVIKSSKNRCSNCNRTGHNSRKCTHPGFEYISTPMPQNYLPKIFKKIRDMEAKKIPNRKHKICRDYKIGSDRYDDIVDGRIYPHPPEIEMAFNDSSISTPQLEISPKHSSSSVGNSEQVIHSSEPVTKKTSRKKKVSSSVELSKGGDLSESKTVHLSILNNQSTSSVPENE
ncbi:10952_t:CDS:2, partial [Entrophospora sp. SA101]